MSYRILYVEDCEIHAEAFDRALSGQGFTIRIARNFEECERLLGEDEYDAILLDQELVGSEKSGVQILKYLRDERVPRIDVPVIFLSGREKSSYGNVVAAMQYGAYNYFDKDSPKAALVESLRNAIKWHRCFEEAKNDLLKYGIVGKGPVFMERLQKKISSAARDDAPALIIGPEGTEKHLIGRAIHTAWARRKPGGISWEARPYEYYPCSSQTNGDDLMTLLDEQSGGTLVLDRIHLLPHTARSRVVGYLKKTPDETRVITITNRTTEGEQISQSLMQDLRADFGQHEIHVPSLKERIDAYPDDMKYLTAFLIQETASWNQCRAIQITDAGWQRLLADRWPGNIRQLGLMIERLYSKSAKTGKISMSPSDIEEALAPDHDL
jgi:DNA-binding NtrC family response regulator